MHFFNTIISMLRWRLVGAVLVCAVVSYIAYLSYAKGVANAQYFSVYQQLKNWQQSPELLTKKSFTMALYSISAVLDKDPSHPHYLHIKANLLVLGISRLWIDKKQLQTAKNDLILATKLRPFWAKSWIDLAKVENYLVGVNDETIYYLHRADTAAPYDYEVNQAVVDILFESWGSLKSSYKPLLFKHLALAALHGPKFVAVFNSAKRHQQLALLCLIVKTHNQYENIRNSWMNTSFCAPSQ